jgi:V-type H+-transporting ATPase subunit H
MGVPLRYCTSVCSRNCKEWIPCSVSWSSSRMRSRVSRLAQYALKIRLICCVDHDERIPLFTKASETDPELPYSPLLRYEIPYIDIHITCSLPGFSALVDTQDDVVQLKAAQILTVLLISESSPIPSHQLQPFLSTLASFIQGSQPNKRDVAVQCLEALLSRTECRKAVWGIPGVIAG